MGRIPSTIVLLAAGIAFLVAAWRGHVSGELVAGRSGFRAYRPNRQDNPLGFYFYLSLYFGMGAIWILWGIFVFLGFLRPIRWR